MLTLPGSRVRFRPISDSWSDTVQVVSWRNSPAARASFFELAIVTPDSHRAFLAGRRADDLILGIELAGGSELIGMLSLTIDREKRAAEYGRLFIDPAYQGQGLAKESEFLILWAGFEWLRLDELWLDALIYNQAVLTLHDRTGWIRTGVDLDGHRSERGPVVHMEYPWDRWKMIGRRRYQAAFERVELPEWTG